MQISYKRVAVCYVLVAVMLFICVCRIFAVVSDEKYSEAAQQMSSKTISLGFSRGTVYDCDMQAITNARSTYIAVIFDQPEALASLYDYFSGGEIEEIIGDIEANGYALRSVSRKIEADGICCVPSAVHSDDSLSAKHIIGYTDDTGKGVSGIEAAFNKYLSSEKENTVTFAMDGQGKRIEGIEPTVTYDHATELKGVRLTLDVDIQQIAEQAAMSIDSGAVIVTEVSTGKIRAIVSRPDYRLSDIASALEDENSPLLNRALCTYNIGSVFKPYVAAAGYEAGIAGEYECVGYTNVDGLTFSCHNLGGHGIVDITAALKYSCNSFFYSYIQSVGGTRVVELARRAGFENAIYLADGISCRAGSLGNTNSLTSKRVLANMSIGQGELLLSPLAITNLYMAIANGGSYRQPSLVEALIKGDNVADEYALPAQVTVMSGVTADRIKADLATVLEEGGTGEKAMPTLTTAAGKTGTAQTGIVKNGEKVTNSWFCGFFPLNEPKYTVTVLSENSSSGCGGVFAEIADGITRYESVD